MKISNLCWLIKTDKEITDSQLEEIKNFINACNLEGITLLTQAAFSKKKDLVKKFIDEYGAYVNAKNSDNTTALDYAAYNYNVPTIHVLIYRGVDVSDKLYGKIKGYEQLYERCLASKKIVEKYNE